mmetsp:Transcript_10557/g.16904  ORF Transcript_10557/g.16904 Transcript_10557/m.16904 type:complete len:207 (+) Transcript_10557:520-1140(+)|eukprot:jgi/Bigna1/88900/estExt_fgenesh1_pg.C_400041
MMRTSSLLFSVAINVALVVTLCLQLRSRAELGATMVRSVRPMVAPRVMNPSRVACNAKKAGEAGMVPDRNSRPDDDIVAKDGSFFDKVFNDWITKKSPTRSLVLDRQRQMNEERAENGGFSLPDFSLPEGGSGGLPEINLEGLSEFSLDPTLKKTVKKTTASKAAPRGGKKTVAAKEEKKGGFSLPFLKPYDNGKQSFSDALNRRK